MTPGDIAVILARLDVMHEDIVEIKGETKKTNGRVSMLEQWRQDQATLSAERERVAAERALTLEADRQDRARVLAEAAQRQVRREDYRRINLPSILIAASGTLVGLGGLLLAVLK